METTTTHDITTEADVITMVDTFYDRVNADDMLAPVFNTFAEVDWMHHLPQMYKFWNSVILALPGYKGQPFPKHLRLPISKAHFDRWLELFTTNIDAHYAGANAELAKGKAHAIAQIFQHKMNLI